MKQALNNFNSNSTENRFTMNIMGSGDFRGNNQNHLTKILNSKPAEIEGYCVQWLPNHHQNVKESIFIEEKYKHKIYTSEMKVMVNGLTNNCLTKSSNNHTSTMKSDATKNSMNKSDTEDVTYKLEDSVTSDSFNNFEVNQQTLAMSSYPVVECHFNYEGSQAACVDLQGRLKIWSFERVTPRVEALITSGSKVKTVKWLGAKRDLCIFGNEGGKIRIFNVKNKKTVAQSFIDNTYPLVHQLEVIKNGYDFLCVSKDSQNEQFKIGLYDTTTMRCSARIQHPFIAKNHITSCNVDESGSLVAVTSQQGEVLVLDLRHPVRPVRGFPTEALAGAPLGVTISSRTNNIYFLNSRNEISLWSWQSRKLMIQTAGWYLPSAMFSPVQDHTANEVVRRYHSADAGWPMKITTDGKSLLASTLHSQATLYQLSNDDGIATSSLCIEGHRSPVIALDVAVKSGPRKNLDGLQCITSSLDGQLIYTSIKHSCS